MLGGATLLLALSPACPVPAGAEGKVFEAGEDLGWLASVQLLAMEVHKRNAYLFGLEASGRPALCVGQVGAAADEQHAVLVQS